MNGPPKRPRRLDECCSIHNTKLTLARRLDGIHGRERVDDPHFVQQIDVRDANFPLKPCVDCNRPQLNPVHDRMAPRRKHRLKTLPPALFRLQASRTGKEGVGWYVLSGASVSASC